MMIMTVAALLPVCSKNLRGTVSLMPVKKTTHEFAGVLFVVVVHRVQVVERLGDPDRRRRCSRRRRQPPSPRLGRSARRVRVGRVKVKVQGKNVEAAKTEADLESIS
jgi:hypothetical protein